jgi:Alcohol dehydrogenase, class IV
MWVYYEYPDTVFEDLVAGKFPKLRTKAKFIAVPSTSGTASEITAFSVITDTKNHIKYPLVSYEMTPDIALLDAVIPSKMPAHITGQYGHGRIGSCCGSLGLNRSHKFNRSISL